MKSYLKKEGDEDVHCNNIPSRILLRHVDTCLIIVIRKQGYKVLRHKGTKDANAVELCR